MLAACATTASVLAQHSEVAKAVTQHTIHTVAVLNCSAVEKCTALALTHSRFRYNYCKLMLRTVQEQRQQRTCCKCVLRVSRAIVRSVGETSMPGATTAL
eukprot:15900-Heterococcus_DN1.PRE.3